EFEQGVLYECGPAQVGFGGRFYPPFIASPFLLKVNLVPSHCGSRALIGRNKDRLFASMANEERHRWD
ncbi:MAG: hypothetical protein ACHRXM_30425, partial [Isosphaerales bacterium]